MENKKRAVVYVRVSTKSDAQTHSFAYQKEYWQNELGQHPDIELVGIYADKGISGKSMLKRPNFMTMLRDGEKKKFDTIYTKSVSRFARNTEELLSVVRKLRDQGINVFFEREQIDTFNPQAELYLIIAAAVAENDLKVYSNNQKWVYRSRYRNGWIFAGSKILGYKMDKETNTLIVEPSQAETVKRIFELYKQGLGFYPISKLLMEEGRLNAKGKPTWDRRSVRYILTNEKYKGCVLLQKTATVNGERVQNNGYETQYFIENAHEAIIPPDEFDKIQEEIKQRTGKRNEDKQSIYPFTGKIICGECGKNFVHKFNNIGKPYQSEIWICHRQNLEGKKQCGNGRIKDTVLKDKFIECFNQFVKGRLASEEIYTLQEQHQALKKKESELTALKINHLIRIEDYNKEVKTVRENMDELYKKINEMEMQGVSQKDYKPITEFDEEKVDKFIDKVVVKGKTITFIFMNGAKISRKFDNGHAGNSKGWLERKTLREMEEQKCWKAE
ncbi:MAG: recombinase family protein [Clostridia bacterium]|nr:recombinase family protein [Clostridia bacterium]